VGTTCLCLSGCRREPLLSPPVLTAHTGRARTHHYSAHTTPSPTTAAGGRATKHFARLLQPVSWTRLRLPAPTNVARATPSAFCAQARLPGAWARQDVHAVGSYDVQAWRFLDAYRAPAAVASAYRVSAILPANSTAAFLAMPGIPTTCGTGEQHNYRYQGA